MPAGNACISRDRPVDHDAGAGGIEIAAHSLGHGYAATRKQRIAVDGLVQIHLPAGDEGIAFHRAAGRCTGSGAEVVAGNNGFVSSRTLLFCGVG